MPSRPESRKHIRDIIILLPGISGSVLKKGGKDVWSLSASALAKGIFTTSMQDLALVDGDDPSLDDLGDGVTADRLMRDVTILPRLWRIDGYTYVGDFLKERIALREGENYFEFPYDWRRDNRVAARKLKQFATQKLEAWQKKTGDAGARVLLIAHSMGGLVSRYFIEVLEGWSITRKLITIGTPHRGSLNALDFLINGYRQKIGPIPLVNLSEMLRSLTSVYQLLPIYPCLDDGNGKMMKLSEKELKMVNAQRLKAASAFHNEIQEAIKRNATVPEYQKAKCEVVPIVGAFQPTLQACVLKGNEINFVKQHAVFEFDGDGTVPQVSAYPVEWDKPADSTVYATERHSSLQNSVSVLANIMKAVGAFDKDLSGFRAEEKPLAEGLRVDVTDLYSDKEDVSFDISSATKLGALQVNLTKIDEEAFQVTKPVNARSTSYRVSTGKLNRGAYRLNIKRASVGRLGDSVSEVFLVMHE